MDRIFNVTGACNPKRHYMVDLTSRLEEIRKMIDRGDYFAINKGRQYGKTTILQAVTKYLKNDYVVINMDFQRLDSTAFESIQAFVSAFTTELLYYTENIPKEISDKLNTFIDGTARINSLQNMFLSLNMWCRKSDKPIVLIVDEVDGASNNQVFLDFLAQLRAGYLSRNSISTFQSVILAGVYDIRNIKRKIRPEEEHKHNSPWNIAAKFKVGMEFSKDDIKGMLTEYENDHKTGMNLDEMSKLIYDYTGGYPSLVSWLCKYMDEDVCEIEKFKNKKSAWSREGFLAAEKIMLEESNPLFESLMGKLEVYPELNKLISKLLFAGEKIPYNRFDTAIQDAEMFGFIKKSDSAAVIANRIFETCLYNRYLLSYKEQNSDIFQAGSRDRDLYIVDGYLNVRYVLERFVAIFNEIYVNEKEAFLEDEGRKYFMLFLRPIINGVGSYTIEPQTRNRERMDLVVDYNGVRSVIEMKIWRGDAYNKRGEEQLCGDLDYLGLKKGYMLSFNFNKNKEIGVKDVVLGDRVVVEAVV